MNNTRHSRATHRQQLCRTLFRVAALSLVAVMAVLLLISGRLPPESWASGETTVRIDPASQEVVMNNTATSDVLIEDVTDLYGYEFQIAFDPTLVEVVDAFPTLPGVQIQPGEFLSQDWILQNTVDNNEGNIAFALSQQDPSPPQDGTGRLATITWRGKAAGASPITITYALLSAPRGESIPVTTQDGHITVTDGFPIPAITSLAPVSVTVGSPSFSLTVNGAGFTQQSTVHWDGEPRDTMFVSSTQLAAEIAAADVANVATVDVTVMNPSPGGGTSNALAFVVEEMSPDTTTPSVYLPLVIKNGD